MSDAEVHSGHGGTGAPQSPQDRIAAFMRAHRIMIDNTHAAGDIEVFEFNRFTADRELEVLGVVRYDEARGGVLSADMDEIERRLGLPGFVNDVIRPFEKLLQGEQGDFYLGDSFAPIHDALDQIEANPFPAA